LEENQPTYLHARRKSLSHHFDRAPSPSTNIDQLRKVLAGTQRVHTTVPKIEVNGEKMATPVGLETPDEEKGDVTDILDSLNVNGEWKEKSIQNVDEAIRPPYAL
jgi:hypothetical protein